MKKFLLKYKNKASKTRTANDEVPRGECVGDRLRVRADVPANVLEPTRVRRPAPPPPLGNQQSPPRDRSENPTNVPGQTRNMPNVPIRVRRPAPPPPPRTPLPPTAPTSDTILRGMGLPVQASTDPPGGQDTEQEMLQQLSCPICLDLFTDPVLLPCLHSLCRACADVVRAHSSSDAFLCPECKQPIGQNPLKKNFPLNNMVDIFKRDAETRKKRKVCAVEVMPRPSVPKSPIVEQCHKSKAVPRLSTHVVSVKKCACCESPNVSPASVSCLQCNMAFCNTCLINYHPTIESTPDHTLQPISLPKNVQSESHRVSVQGGLCNVMGSMIRVHEEMLQTFRQKP